MSNGNSGLALALGAGAGLGLWYLLRDHDLDQVSTPTTPPAAPTAASSSNASGRGTPCALRLDRRGLTADGIAIDIATAVARCTAKGRADLVYAKDGPAQVYLELNAAFAKAGVAVSVRRA